MFPYVHLILDHIHQFKPIEPVGSEIVIEVSHLVWSSIEVVVMIASPDSLTHQVIQIADLLCSVILFKIS